MEGAPSHTTVPSLLPNLNDVDVPIFFGFLLPSSGHKPKNQPSTIGSEKKRNEPLHISASQSASQPAMRVVVVVTMLLLNVLTRPARAFSVLRTATPSATRLFSSAGMPYPDDQMPFYALGANLAVQVGGQANFKSLLNEDEMEIALTAFCETLRGTNTVETRQVLQTFGPQLNKVLQERTANIMDRVKADGAEYLKNFLECNEEAVQTDSGLVYCPMVEGDGAQPKLSDSVEVHYHGTLTDGTVFDSSEYRRGVCCGCRRGIFGFDS